MMRIRYWLIFWMLWGCFSATGAGAFSCQVSAGTLNFPSYNFLSSFPTDSTATLRISCNIPDQNPRAPLAVTLSIGSGTSGSFSQRQMYSLSGGSDSLKYNLFTNASYSSILGDGTGSSTTLTQRVSKSAPWNVVVYGRIPPNQKVPAGQYRDSLIVTIDW